MDTAECTCCLRSHLCNCKFIQFSVCQHVYLTTSFQNAESAAIGHDEAGRAGTRAPLQSERGGLRPCSFLLLVLTRMQACLLRAGITIYSPFWIQKRVVVTAVSVPGPAAPLSSGGPAKPGFCLPHYRGPDPSQQPDARYTSNAPALSTGSLSQVSCYP